MSGLNDLRPPAGSRRSPKRVGRGESSGHGKTSGRGNKGQNSRSGRRKRHPAFEGGQMPLVRRVPKRGFTNLFRIEYAVVNVESLNRFAAGSVVGAEELRAAGLLKSAGPFKVLGQGDLERALTVRAHQFSASAQKKIEAAGGKVETL
jgi:large subunit ribosomal protein L15